jgi:hypothetical protein
METLTTEQKLHLLETAKDQLMTNWQNRVEIERAVAEKEGRAPKHIGVPGAKSIGKLAVALSKIVA